MMLGNIVVKAIFLLLAYTYGESPPQPDVAGAAIASPDYARWGKLAMEETAKTYSGAAIHDYKYEGRASLTEGVVEERFVLWLNHRGREFRVRVVISVDAASERLRSVSLSEL